MPPEGTTLVAPPRDRWVTLGMAIATVSAAVSSFAGLHGLAVVTGWPELLAPLLPLSIDSLAMTAMRVWLTGSATSLHARRFARACAIGAIFLSLAGNAVWHLIAAHLLRASWGIVLGVGAIPPTVLGAVTHMAALRTESGTDPASTVLSSPPASENRTQYGSEAELLEAARQADADHKAAHDGKPITRDELRKRLRVSGARATAVLRELRSEQNQSSDS